MDVYLKKKCVPTAGVPDVAVLRPGLITLVLPPGVVD